MIAGQVRVPCGYVAQVVIMVHCIVLVAVKSDGFTGSFYKFLPIPKELTWLKTEESLDNKINHGPTIVGQEYQQHFKGGSFDRLPARTVCGGQYNSVSPEYWDNRLTLLRCLYKHPLSVFRNQRWRFVHNQPHIFCKVMIALYGRKALIWSFHFDRNFTNLSWKLLTVP